MQRWEKSILLVILVLGIGIVGCEKEDHLIDLTTDAQIIDFVGEKCYCCWGWVIKVDSDTIKADELPNSDLIGHEITAPINVKIKIGEKKTDCPNSAFDYYEIKSLIVE